MDDFAAEWARCKGYLAPACCDGWTIDDVEQECRARRATFWPMERSAAVTVVVERPSGRVCRIWLAGGELDELRYFLPAGEQYAREQGCISMEIDGRPGWERALAGYRKHAIVLVKELDHE